MTSMRNSFLRYVAQTSTQPDGFEVKRGDGIYLYDQHDNAYIDCISGIAVSSFGHNHPQITKGIHDQLQLHLHTMVYGEHIQAPQVKLAERLAALLPPRLNCTYFTNSGAEAVEGALKLARLFTGRYEIIACRNAYHGSTAGAESLRSDRAHTDSMRPLVPGVKHIDFNSIEDLELITRHTAAVIIEPVQGEAGVVLPDKDYLKSVEAKCKAAGALLIADEIQCGMGRTGTFCAFEQENIVPDVLLLAKAFGGGLPLGAFIADRSVMECLSTHPPLGHLTTFGGHPLSCAASIAAINILHEGDFMDRVTQAGERIKANLQEHSAIKEIRGRGLMLAIELNDASTLMEAVHACRREGLLVDWFLFSNQSIRLYPPLIISEEETDQMCEKLTRAIQ